MLEILLLQVDITTTVLRDMELLGFLIFSESIVTGPLSLSPSFEMLDQV